jgi:hypothetical protein
MNAPEKLTQYDRDAQVVGNIVHLEHFNVVIDDQRLATDTVGPLPRQDLPDAPDAGINGHGG